ncbi:MAG: SPOR domain-containing protein [Desulfuromonadaceae bacterium]|nr:SPOR domain-containing protein [Desulfuromonadaceae bacterium]
MTQAEYKRVPRTSGRRKLMVLASMVLLLCLACFGLGLMVGGSSLKTSDSKSKPVSATVRVGTVAQPGERHALKAEAQRGNSARSGAGDTTDSKAATQADGVSAAEREAAAERVAAAVEDALIEKPVVRETPLGSGINLRKKSGTSADPAAEGALPSASASAVQNVSGKGTVAVSASSPPKATLKGTKGGSYVVQIAAFRRDADAQRLAQKLKTDFPVYVHQVDLADKGQWFRVLAGPVTERAEADLLKQKVKEKAGIEGFVKKHSEN